MVIRCHAEITYCSYGPTNGRVIHTKIMNIDSAMVDDTARMAL